MRRKTCLVVLFILLASILHAQSLTLSVSSKSIGSQDGLQVTYTFSNLNVDQFPNIEFSGWTVEQGPFESSMTQIVNGKSSSQRSFTFVLNPSRTGTLLVPGISVNAGGKKISCNGVPVSVSTKPHLQSNNNNDDAADQSANNSFQQMQQMQQQMQQQMANIFGDMDADNMPQSHFNGIIVKPGQSLEDAVKGKIFIHVLPSKTTCYLGEPISVDYEIYSSVNCSANATHIPSFGSFSVTDVNQSNGVYTAQLNGQSYHAQSIRKAQLVALKTGDLTLDSAVLTCRVNYYDATDPGNPKTGNITIKNSPSIIHVIPLPDKNKPADFSGAVGSFTINADADKISLPAQENNILHIQINGTGSLDNVSSPEINFPANIQAFDSKDSQSIDKSAFPMQVTRTFDIPFIGNQEGSAIIPPVKFTYFDPQKKDYQTISSDSLRIAFSAPIKHDYNTDKTIVRDEGNKKYLWLVALVGILALVYYFIKDSINKKKKYRENKATGNVVNEKPFVKENPEQALESKEVIDEEAVLQNKKDKLSEAFQHLENEQDNHQFFVLSKALLIQYLQEKLDSASTDENALLQEAGKKYPEEMNELEKLFKRCTKALYLPVVSEQERGEVLKRIKLLVHSFVYSVNL